MNKYPFLALARHCKDLTFDFLICDGTAEGWYSGERQEFTEALWVREHVKPGFHCIDCGSHHGMMAMIMALAAGPTGQVSAYDALPRNAEIVRINAQLNGLANVRARGVGVGNSAGQMSVSENAGNSLVSNDPNADSTASIETVRLDDDYRGRVDFLKLDVEGFEIAALEGAQKLLSQRPILNIELHNFMLPDPEAHVREVLSLLPAGYSWAMVDDMFDPPTPFDAATLASFRNPHLLGTPA